MHGDHERIWDGKHENAPADARLVLVKTEGAEVRGYFDWGEFVFRDELRRPLDGVKSWRPIHDEMEREATRITTLTGIQFDLINPTAGMVRGNDIVFALSHLARFNGHVGLYTVAQHSLLVARLLPAELELYGLLHDAAEAYTGDVVRPLKKLLGWRLRSIERRIEAAIATRFGLRWTDKIVAAVKHADNVALCTEARDLLGGVSIERELPAPDPETIVVEPVDVIVDRFRSRLNYAWEQFQK